MENTFNAAKYYLEYQGLPSTQKRVEKLINQMGDQAVLRLAKDRGYTETTQ